METNTQSRILLVDDQKEIHRDFKSVLCPAVGDESVLNKLEQELFVEDHTVQEKQTATVETITYELVSAYQGQEALERVKESFAADRPFRVAFVDMRMPPGWDGLTTIEHLWECDPRLQIVICSAYSDQAWKDIISRLGTTDKLLILNKPFAPEEARQMASHLSQKWYRENRIRSIYTVSAHYPLEVIEITPRRATERAIFFDGYVALPDGTQRKMILAQEDRPDSPIRALEMFITHQKKHIHKAKRTLESEYGRLEQAEELLAQICSRQAQI